MTKQDNPGSQKWVTVYTMSGDTYAEMVKEALSNAGIPCNLQRSDISATFGTHSQSLLAEVEILVPEEDAEKALTVIEGIIGEENRNDSQKR